MTSPARDPLTVLRLPTEPVRPDESFSTRLRAEVERALTAPGGAHVSATANPVAESPALAIPTGVVPYLAVRDARSALRWYAEALGAEETGQRYEGDDGRVGHAEMRVEGAVFYLSDGAPELGVEPADPDPETPVHTSLVLMVPDTDAATDRAVEAGARLERAPGDNPYGRVAVVRDPYGHRWMLEGPLVPAAGRTAPEQARPGDLAYAMVCTPDAERTAAFYTAVLGWRVGPGSIPAGRSIDGLSLPLGIWGDRDELTICCCWWVDDVDAAVQRVRAAGGTADEPTDEPYGRMARCVDDQGVELFVVSGTDRGPRSPLNGSRQGDLSYLTLHAPDRSRTVAFYASVLGWQVDGQADPADVRPMLGIAAGGTDAAVAMWKVDDVAAARERVLAAGGTAGEIEQPPYGARVRCVDDQGMEFWLGEA